MKPGLAMLSAVIASISPAALPAEVDTTSIDARFGARPDLLLCAVYAINPSDTLHAELVSRQRLTDADWQAISRKQVREGSGECAALAVYGVPSSIGDKAFNMGRTLYSYPHFPNAKDPAGGFSVKDGIVDQFFVDIIVH